MGRWSVVDLTGWSKPKEALTRECLWICEDLNRGADHYRLRHMGANEGDVWRYVDRPGQKKRAEHLVDLGWAPFAFTQDSPDAVLVLTSDGFVRVHTSGRLETVYRIVYGILYPGSIAISPNGVIHAGMRHFVTRLTPSAGTYKDEWFVPANCAQFTQQKYDCVCTGATAND